MAKKLTTTGSKLPATMERINKILTRQIKLKVAEGTRDSLAKNIISTFPSKTGKTLQLFDPIYGNATSTKTIMVGRFPTIAPELMQRGLQSPSYPYNPDTGATVFIPDWIDAVGLRDRFPNGYVRVGYAPTTRYGRPENQWFTFATNATRNDLNKPISSRLNTMEI